MRVYLACTTLTMTVQPEHCTLSVLLVDTEFHPHAHETGTKHVFRNRHA